MLRREHAAIGTLLVPMPDAALRAELASILEAHDAKEETPAGAYADCEQRIGPELSATLAEQAAAYPIVRAAAPYDGPGTVRTAAEALGGAGVGKTRLVDEVFARIQGRERRVRTFRGASRDGGPAFEVVAKILRARFGMTENMDTPHDQTRYAP